MRKAFHGELDQIGHMLVDMSEAVAVAVDDATSALLDADLSLAEKVISGDAGIDRVLSETDLITGAVTTAVEHDAIRHAMLIGDGAAIAFELTIPAGSVGAGRTVMELVARPDFPKSGVFAALYREGGGVEAPRGSSVVDAGTTVLLVAQRDDVHAAIVALTSPGA